MICEANFSYIRYLHWTCHVKRVTGVYLHGWIDTYIVFVKVRVPGAWHSVEIATDRGSQCNSNRRKINKVVLVQALFKSRGDIALTAS